MSPRRYEGSKWVKMTRMPHELLLSPEAIENYLASRPRSIRWLEWVRGRRYRVSLFRDRPLPLVIIAHSFRVAGQAVQIARALDEDWAAAPPRCREAYEQILRKASGIVIVQLRRRNVCGCLGHRHVVVKEAPFTEPHEAFGGAAVGEMDIAYERVENWQALPLMDTALDTKFLEGTRLEEFHAEQLRLRLLSVLLHEINHFADPSEPEASIRERSLAFYREALAGYVETATATLSLTIDRSFSRLG